MKPGNLPSRIKQNWHQRPSWFLKYVVQKSNPTVSDIFKVDIYKYRFLWNTLIVRCFHTK